VRRSRTLHSKILLSLNSSYNNYLFLTKDQPVPSENIVPQRSLGKTNIKITPIGLGMMEFSGGGGLMGFAFPTLSQEEKNATVRAALNGGINWFDTAELYGKGVSETSLATALKAAGKKDDEVVVATKWWPLLRTARNIPHSIRDRLRYLDGYSISLYMVHQPYSFSSPEAEMDAMADLVEAGKIRSVGVSNFSATHMRRAHRQLEQRGLPLAANQVQYSLLDRSIETNGILETAKELVVTIIAYTPLASGLLTGKYHKNPELLKNKPFYWRSTLQRGIEKSRPLVQALEEIATHYDATPAQVALNWVIHFHGETIVTIPGATRASQAQESAGAQRFNLTDDEMARLDELSSQYR
jgi:aryl-alcohol dehydrogenase-like predicted oxidoreductase